MGEFYSGIGVRLTTLTAAALLVAACASTKPAPTLPPAAPSPPAAPAPQGPTPGSVADFNQNVGDRVFFDFDKSNLDSTDMATLDKQAAWLARYPSVTVTVEGHCDERGTREYNIALGARRAASVKDYLVSKGVNSSRIETISYGKERPVCVQSNEACWSQNRRGVTVISGGATS